MNEEFEKNLNGNTNNSTNNTTASNTNSQTGYTTNSNSTQSDANTTANGAYSLNKDQIYSNTEYANHTSTANNQNNAYQNNTGAYNTSSYSNTSYNNASSENKGYDYTNPVFGQYNNNTANNTANSKADKKEAKRQKKQARKAAKAGKKSSAFARGTKFVAAAACFGLIAGGIGYGTNYGLVSLLDNKKTTVQSTDNKTTMSVNSVNTNYQSVGVTVMDVSSIVEQAMPSIVAINGTVTSSGSYYAIPGFGSFGSNSSTESPVSGSGIIIGQSDTELLMVTNAHVVSDVNNLSVTFCNDEKVDAYVKGAKTSKDIAVVAVKLSDMSEDALSQIKVATIGDSDSVKVGQAAIAIGNALGYGQSVTSGCISALDRSITVDSTTYDGLIQTDAAINPGNSGGALLDASGNLIGINSAKASSDSVEGMGYAIPISSVKDLINELMNKEARQVVSEEERGYLGIYGVTVTEDVSSSYGYPQGVYVRDTVANSGAEAAGIVQGDIICEVDGNDITDMTDLTELLEYYKSGETISVTVYRLSDSGYSQVSVDVTLTSKSTVNADDNNSNSNKNSNKNNDSNSDNSNKNSDSSDRNNDDSQVVRPNR